MGYPDISYEELKRRLLDVEPLRSRALFCLTYAALGRVGEIVRSKYDLNNTPIMKKQLQLTDKHLILSIITEKWRHVRKVPVNYEKEEWLVYPIMEYIEPMDEDEYIFPYSTRWAQYRFREHFGTENIHLLRHWRTTHLLNGSVTGKPLRMRIVQKMGGWSTTATISRVYDHTIVEDYIDEI